jgi:hypothetical protein
MALLLVAEPPPAADQALGQILLKSRQCGCSRSP